MESSRQAEHNSRARSICSCGKSGHIQTKLMCVSFVLNIVFVVLFVVVFIRLANNETRFEKLESPSIASEEPGKRTLRGNSSRLTPFPVLTTNATAPPNLIKVRAFSHCQIDRNIFGQRKQVSSGWYQKFYAKSFPSIRLHLGCTIHVCRVIWEMLTWKIIFSSRTEHSYTDYTRFAEKYFTIRSYQTLVRTY